MKQDSVNYVIDFKNVKSYHDIHIVMKNSMKFPEYYGYNLDALWDCLTDLICYDHVTLHFKNFHIAEKYMPEKVAVIYEQLISLKHHYNGDYYDVFEIYVEKNGITEEIK